MNIKKASDLLVLSKHPLLRTYLTLGGMLVLLLVTSLACTFDVHKPNFGEPQTLAGPFTAKDCEIPFMPQPVTNEDEIYNTNIYCVFHFVNVDGIMYFSLSYSANVGDAVKEYTIWHDDIVNNYSKYTAITDSLEELFVMQVTRTADYSNTNEDIAAVQIYKQHFVIQIKGYLKNTGQSAAEGMVTNLFDYGNKIADEHYPGYH